ncbi:hypothetical protein K450DRAFT_244458 [Umbelopsis ramanniana AG]|uniref:RNA polymerase II transcription factor B subunit 3 n=1 Tax=Umbelopsis ramanniana AG TaxID=1314678 RepID=A0AAD5HDY2_UMBRA|nr:uncharacterized protein K450DRAFT_244458 [Umbelopsis ramanniana AG]KAI8578986.1 hypothetical protein K450DRAFT_244458 [Umbelopsis ramanniana AG]
MIAQQRNANRTNGFGRSQQNTSTSIRQGSATVISYQEEDAQCPVCKSDKYLTPNLKLLVSPCFHKMCESCIDRLFSAGPAPCPICLQTLRKNQFMSQIFEDLNVEKEVRIRKKVSRIFNKRPEDFSSLRTYNDYLEEVEDITFNLINEVDVAETEAKMARYEKENKDSIAANEARSVNEMKKSSYQEEIEKQEKEQRLADYRRQLEEEKLLKEREKLDLIRELATSNKPAHAVLATRQTSTLKKSSALRQQRDANAQRNNLLPAWLKTSIPTDVDMKEAADLENFDPLGLEYQDPTTPSIMTTYNDP